MPTCAPSALEANHPIFSPTLPVQSPGVGFKADLRPQQGEGPYNSTSLTGKLHDSLGRIYVRMDAFKGGQDLSEDFKQRLQQDLAQARIDGIKVVLRFAYNYPCQPAAVSQRPGAAKLENSVCPQDAKGTQWDSKSKTGNPFNDPNFSDASLETILKHIRQLGPILQANADVITGMGGFIGRWGEQHHSTSGNGAFTSQAQIIQAMNGAFPGQILMRYPAARSAAFQATTPNHLLASAQTHVGLENDCFLASDQDKGTYQGKDSQAIADEKLYVASVGAHSLIGGETCQINPPRSNCTTALKELKQLHFSYLTDGFPPAVFNGWKGQSGAGDPVYQPAVDPKNDSEAPCFDFIKSHLGYRFALKDLKMDSQIKPGGVFHINATASNEGFAALADSRPTYAVLKCGAGWQSELLPLSGSNTNAQSWSAGVDTKMTAAIAIPKNAPEGKCSLTLSLPDGCDPIDHHKDIVETQRSANCRANRANPKFSIQLANTNGWNSRTGLNELSRELVVSNKTLPVCTERQNASRNRTSRAAY